MPVELMVVALLATSGVPLGIYSGDTYELRPEPQLSASQDVTPLLDLAMSLRSERQYDRALGLANEAVEKSPYSARAHNTRGLILQDMERYAESIDDFTRTISLDPSIWSPYYNRANVYLSLLEYEKAIADFDHAIALNPSAEMAFVNRGNAFRESGHAERSLMDYAEAIRIDPADALAYSNRASALRDIGRSVEAISDYSAAISLSPDNADYFYDRSITLAENSQFDEALRDIDSAIVLEPDVAQFAASRGLILSAIAARNSEVAQARREDARSREDAEVRETRMALRACVERAAGRLERSGETADIVADASITACAREREVFFSAAGVGENWRYERELATQIDPLLRQLAQSRVVEIRAGRPR